MEFVSRKVRWGAFGVCLLCFQGFGLMAILHFPRGENNSSLSRVVNIENRKIFIDKSEIYEIIIE